MLGQFACLLAAGTMCYLFWESFAAFFKAKQNETLIVFVSLFNLYIWRKRWNGGSILLLDTTKISTVTVFTNVRNLITFIPHTTTN